MWLICYAISFLANNIDGNDAPPYAREYDIVPHNNPYILYQDITIFKNDIRTACLFEIRTKRQQFFMS